MSQFRNSLSLKIISLTLLLALMTVLSALSGVKALNDFKGEYQAVKENYFSTLIKVSELRRQSQDIINASTEMFLTEDLAQLQWHIYEVADKKQWVDKIVVQLEGDTISYLKLYDLKMGLYGHIDELVRRLKYKFKLEEEFLASYRAAVALKNNQLNNNDIQQYITMDKAIAHFNPIINQDIELNRSVDLKALSTLINSQEDKLDPAELVQIREVFTGPASLASTYQAFVDNNEKIEQLRKKNENFNDLFVSTLVSEVHTVQTNVLDTLNAIEREVSKRKISFYIVIFICVIATIVFVFIQVNFIKRILLLR